MPARRPRDLRTVACALLLFLGTLLLYARSAQFGFSNYDDPRYILNNTAIHGGFTAESLRWAFTGHGDIWNPLVRLTHILDVQLFGLAAAGHHLHSILWHALNAALAFLLLRRLTGSFWTSALGAALFAWHPLRVESVSWISERKDVVSVAFGLLTLLAYLAYVRRRAAGARGGWRYGLALLAFAAALLSKPSMVALPGVLPLLDYWPLGRYPFAPAPADDHAGAAASTAPLLLEKIPFAALAAIAAYITIHTQTAAGDFVLDLPLGARLANAVVSLPRYLGMFFWPFDLSIAYSHPGWWPAPILVAAAFAVAAISVVAWTTRRTRPWIIVGWLWFVGTLLPMIGLVQVGFQAIADRYTYFPMLGWQIALLWTLRHYLPRTLPRWLAPALAGLTLLGCAARTWHQQGFWRDPISLNRQAVAAAPNSPTAHSFLAYSYATELRYTDARFEAERALALDPKNTVAILTLARVEAAEAHHEAALARYRELLVLQPHDTTSALEFAHLLLTIGRRPEAEEVFRTVPTNSPDAPYARLGLTLAALARQDRAAAYEILFAANTEYPANAAVLERLAMLLHQDGRDTETAARFAQALALQPRSADLLRVYGAFLHATGRPDEALAAFDRAIAARPHDPALRQEKAQLLAVLGRLDEAFAVYLAILAEHPEDALTAFEVGGLCEKRGDTARALELYRQAVDARPLLIPAQLALARLTEAAGQRAETDAVLAKALTAAPQAAILHRSYAEMLAQRRQFEPAMLHYARAVELDPGDAEAHAGYGYLLFFTGKRVAALGQWETALQLRPDFPGLDRRVERLRRELAPHD
jgi:tetratricopeptide (TPR) repeat protein